MQKLLMRCCGIATIFLALSASASHAHMAQDTQAGSPAMAAPADGTCEFHVWPGDEMMSVYYGWFHGSTVNGQVQGRRGYPKAPADPVDVATQRIIMEEVQPQRQFGKEAYRLVLHDAPLPSTRIRNAGGRITDSTASCYAELVLDDVVLQQDAFNGSFLKSLFHYRDFGADATPRRSFATWVQTDLDAMSPRTEEQMEAAVAEIRQAYRTNISLFATSAMRPPRRRR